MLKQTLPDLGWRMGVGIPRASPGQVALLTEGGPQRRMQGWAISSQLSPIAVKGIQHRRQNSRRFCDLFTYVSRLWSRHEEAAALGCMLCLPYSGQVQVPMTWPSQHVYLDCVGSQWQPCATWTSATFPWTLRPALWSWRAVSIVSVIPSTPSLSDRCCLPVSGPVSLVWDFLVASWASEAE
jgi:hypothetical protein